MKDYSEKLVELMNDPEYKNAIDELLRDHSVFVNECRDVKEKLAREKGMTYERFTRWLDENCTPEFMVNKGNNQ